MVKVMKWARLTRDQCISINDATLYTFHRSDPVTLSPRDALIGKKIFLMMIQDALPLYIRPQ